MVVRGLVATEALGPVVDADRWSSLSAASLVVPSTAENDICSSWILGNEKYVPRSTCGARGRGSESFASALFSFDNSEYLLPLEPDSLLSDREEGKGEGVGVWISEEEGEVG